MFLPGAPAKPMEKQRFSQKNLVFRYQKPRFLMVLGAPGIGILYPIIGGRFLVGWLMVVFW